MFRFELRKMSAAIGAWSPRRKRILAGASGAAIVALVAATAFGPLVRSRVAREAAKRGLVVTVGSVRPGWLGVTLEDVSLAPEGTSGIHAHAEKVSVGLGLALSVKSVAVNDVHADIEGDALAEISAWRARHPTRGEAGGMKMALSVERAALSWKHAFGDPDASVEVSGLAGQRDEAGTRVSSESVVVTRRRATVTLGASSAEIEHGKLKNAHVESARMALALTENDDSTGRPPATTPLEPPPPPPSKRDRTGTAPEPFHPIVPLPNLHMLRAMLQNAGNEISEHAPDGFHVGLDALTIEVQRGAEKLELGPGKLTAERRGNALVSEFSAGTGQTPLTLHAALPLSNGDTVVALAGGPVSLSMLGVREGAFGFADPARANVTGKARLALDDAATTLTFDGDLSANDVSIQDRRLADDTVRGLDVRVSARGVLDDAGKIRLDDSEAQLGALHLRGHGEVEETNDHLAAALALELPVAGCESLLESIPAALLPHVSAARFQGTLGAKGYLAFDTRKLNDLVLKYDFDDGCRAQQVPEDLRKDRFAGGFSYAIVDKDGKPSDRETGPGSDEWSPLDTISPMMQVAVLTTEDGGFFHHRGVNGWAIRSALIADIKAGRFVRGASTITMQLAKNLFLSRQKTLSRKLEELILTDYLERTFTKEEMMELYLNVIEFGPDIYGVRSAAEHYFGRRPAELNLAECLFLSSLLPNPRGYHTIWEKGVVPQSWMNQIHQLMEVAHKNGRISDKDLEEAKTQTIELHHEDAPRPSPRAAVHGAHFGTGDDVWEPN